MHKDERFSFLTELTRFLNDNKIGSDQIIAICCSRMGYYCLVYTVQEDVE